MQDKLTGILIGIARATEGNEDKITAETDRIIIEGLCSAITNAGVNNKSIQELIERAEEEKRKLIPLCYECACPCGRNDNYDMENLRNAEEDSRSLRSVILIGIRGIAAYAHHAAMLGYTDQEVNNFFYKALFAVGMDDWGTEELLPIAMEAGAVGLKCKELLDRANIGM